MESDAVVNGILSFVIPGLGQAIEGYKIRGLALLLVAVVMHAVLFYFNLDNAVHYMFSAAYGLVAGYDAYRLY